MEKIKIYIYGAGQEYERFHSYFIAYSHKIEVMGIVTTEPQDISCLDGHPCITAKNMKIENVDYIVIAIEKWKEVADYLKTLGIDDEKIIPSKVFSLPYFELEDYLALKKEKVTILSNSCLAAFIYKELGLPYNSPTIWLYCLAENYFKFLEKYEYYLNKEMKVYEKTIEYQGSPYCIRHEIPKGIIDNEVLWDFPHSLDAEKTVQEWNKRKKRCNFDNIAVLMILHTDEEALCFEKLPYKKKLGIYYKDLNLSSVICCEEWKDRKVKLEYGYNWTIYVHKVLTEFGQKKGKVNWIQFLLGKEEFIRY